MTTFFGVSGKELYIKDLSWRFLSEFILDKCANVIREDEKQAWQEMEGKIISKETAVAIAGQLERLIQQGVVESFRTELEFENLGQHFTEETLRKFIQFCRVSNGFDIW
jgi:predicted house-cleaning NTP pyrophosphatase (Maf/HAM1 superfamily)